MLTPRFWGKHLFSLFRFFAVHQEQLILYEEKNGQYRSYFQYSIAYSDFFALSAQDFADSAVKQIVLEHYKGKPYFS